MICEQNKANGRDSSPTGCLEAGCVSKRCCRIYLFIYPLFVLPSISNHFSLIPSSLRTWSYSTRSEYVVHLLMTSSRSLVPKVSARPWSKGCGLRHFPHARSKMFGWLCGRIPICSGDASLRSHEDSPLLYVRYVCVLGN